MNRTISLALAAVALTVTAGACRPRGPITPERAQKYAASYLDDALDDLDATDQQKERIQSIAKPLVSEAVSIHAEGKKSRKELVAQWASDKPDGKAVHALIDAQAEKITGLVHKVADAVIEVHGVLDAKQRAEVTEHLQKHCNEE